MSFLSHLECAFCGKRLEADKVWNLCPDCANPLLVRYRLDEASSALSRDAFAGSEANLWRYRDLLPVKDDQHIFSLGEGFTPLIHATRLGEDVGFEQLLIKEEGLNPTGSFKARGLCVAISRAHELGVEAVSIPSAGNAAGAMAAYAALAAMEAYVFMPQDVPPVFAAECRTLGAKVTLVDGLITDCGRMGAQEIQNSDRFDVSTLKEPYRLEGKKTMGYELAEQMGWSLPDVIIYPTGGGTGLIGMWKAFQEMRRLGWLGPDLPRMVTVQPQGCAPMVRAFHKGDEFAEPWRDAQTIADGLRVPRAVGDFLILRALRESDGTAVAVRDEEMIDAARQIGRTQGIFVCPEGGATLAAFRRLRRQDWIGDDESVVLFNTGSGLKYAHLFSQ